jgi:hypothetical protein
MKKLLDWLTENGGCNYIKYHGRHNSLSEQQTAEIVAHRINAFGVCVVRSAKLVLNKIYHLEKSFRSAHDFANSEIGAGMLESDNEETFSKFIIKNLFP